MLIVDLIYRNPIKISCGGYTTCIINNSKIHVFNDFFKNLNTSDINIELIGCGYQYVVVSSSEGKIYGWGRNESGQLGLGFASSTISFSRIPSDDIISDVKSISCGSSHTIILTPDGECYVCGSNDCGQLGVGNYIRNICSPTKLSLTNIIETSCGDSYSMFLRKNGLCFSCGLNDSGQLGLGDTDSRLSPQIINLSKIISISCGRFHSVALTFDQKIHIWGSNSCGQLGIKNHTIGRMYSLPQKLELNLCKKEFVISTKCGAFHTMALTNIGSLYVWGSNSEGQLGLGRFVGDKFLPTKFKWRIPIVSICCGSYHSVMMTSSNEIYGCGSNSHKQLTPSRKNCFKPTPCQIKL